MQVLKSGAGLQTLSNTRKAALARFDQVARNPQPAVTLPAENHAPRGLHTSIPTGAGSRVVVKADMTSSFASTASGESALGSFEAELDFGYCSAQGIRDTMEDEVQVHFQEEGNYLYAAVFDGHGGDAAAQWLSKQLHVHLDECIRGLCSDECPADGSIVHPDKIGKMMAAGFERADRTLISHLRETGGSKVAQAGATGTVAIVKDRRLVVANVGDSQAVLCRKGTGVAIAHTHRVYGHGPDVASEIERVKATGGWVDDGRVCGVLAVSRAFGDWEFKGEGLPHLLANGIQKGYWDAEFASQQRFSADPVVVTPDVTEAQLTVEDEFLIVASDGLWDVMQPREAVAFARKEFKTKGSAQKIAERLTDIALKRYSTDNIAVVVVDLQGPAYWGAKPAKKKPFSGLFGKK